MRTALRLFRSDQICLDLVRTVRLEELPAGEYRALSVEPFALKQQVATIV
jgi:hypothetical protein